MSDDTKPCWQCEGSGECSECDGVGEYDCHECGVGTIRCDDCDASGECWMCDGKGTEPVTETDLEKAGQFNALSDTFGEQRPSSTEPPK